MLYLAYGSNMSSKRLRSRAASAEFVAVARLSAHVLKFHKKSDKDGSGKCDAYFTGDDGQFLFGALYKIDEAHWSALDAAEGLGAGYEKKRVSLTSPGAGDVEAFTYYATVTDPSLQPLCWYKEHVLRGAEEHGLPQAYVEMIRSAPVADDLDEARRLRELSIYAPTRSG